MPPPYLKESLNMENIFIELLPPWIETGLQPAFYDKESGSVLQQTARMYAKINDIIKNVNNQNTIINDYISKFDELHTYVYDYFDNLDVQEEINNKLDQLVESGELQRILNSPATTDNIGGVIVKDGLNVDETGNLSVKAGNGVKVDAEGVSVLPLYIDGLETVFYGYTNETTNTNVHYVIIPAGNKPKIVMAESNNANTRKTASEFDYKYKPTVMANLAPWDTSNDISYGTLIIDGDIKIENNLGSGTYWNRPTIGIDENGKLHCINGSTPADEVNMPYACRAWACIYNDGDVNPNMPQDKDPRTFLAQDYNGNYLIGVCGGRQADDTGMNLEDILDFVRNEINFNARLIFNLDGGGSSNLLFHGIRQNKLIAREDRACPNWIVWGADSTIDDGIYQSQSINNMNNITQEIDEGGHIILADDIRSGKVTSERVNVSSVSRIMKVTPRVVNYVLNFNVTAGDNLPAYTDLFTNLPRTEGNIYATMLKHSDYSLTPIQLKVETGYSRIRNIKTLAPDTYTITLTVPCDTQY